jgi:hypothetical protein
MDIRQIVQSIVRDVVEAEIKAALAESIGGLTDATPVASGRSTGASQPVQKTDGRSAIGPRVNYWLTHSGKAKHAGDSLASNNAKVFAYIRKHEGRTKRQIAGATGIPPHSCESNVNQLQQMGLIESRAIR